MENEAIDIKAIADVLYNFLKIEKCADINKINEYLLNVAGVEISPKILKELSYKYPDKFEYLKPGVYMGAVGWEAIDHTLCISGYSFEDVEEEKFLRRLESELIKKIQLKTHKDIAIVKAELENKIREIEEKLKYIENYISRMRSEKTKKSIADTVTTKNAKNVVKVILNKIEQNLLSPIFVKSKLEECFGIKGDTLEEIITNIVVSKIGEDRKKVINEILDCLLS